MVPLLVTLFSVSANAPPAQTPAIAVFLAPEAAGDARLRVGIVRPAGDEVQLATAVTETDLVPAATVKQSAPALAFSPDGRRFALLVAARRLGELVTDRDERRLVVGNTGGGGLVWGVADNACVAIRCFETMLGFAADGRSVFTELRTMHGARVHAYDSASLVRRRHFDESKGVAKAGTELSDLLLSPTGTEIVFVVHKLEKGGGNYAESNLYRREAGQKGAARKLGPLAREPGELPWWHDGTLLVSAVYGPGEEEIDELVVDTISTSPKAPRRTLFEFKRDAEGKNRGAGVPVLAAGTTLVFLDAIPWAMQAQDLVAVRITDGTELARLPGCGDPFAVSRDGRRLACAAWRISGDRGPAKLLVHDLDAGSVQTLVVPESDALVLRALAFVEPS